MNWQDEDAMGKVMAIAGLLVGAVIIWMSVDLLRTADPDQADQEPVRDGG